jgi:hypothetical protein
MVFSMLIIVISLYKVFVYKNKQQVEIKIL